MICSRTYIFNVEVISPSLAEVFCWISNGRALLLVLGVPVAIILLFNIGALALTMISIWKVQKVFGWKCYYYYIYIILLLVFNVAENERNRG